ncbi:BlaI/MecI/CopY family transcriptional regulator [Mangrovivirga cuniculi]|uniref:Penicillinase repressor n=1 Tax=Mangrovivirga cuniculi TaxID=2715131 RepID=A0A4D7JWU8_9BACT|nr:BlaI/MecI/CopY family transcriptional regulator [Mangrovivirga cuniculi]QCK16596.1 penicillinase repressor [Mangrovivirga cuniculi]
MDNKQLNKSELQIMKYLWKIEKGFLKDIVDQFPQPGPAYTTISTLISRMVNKNYIGYTKMGRDKEYYPIIKKNDYFKTQIKSIVSDFFNNSSSQFASFFTKNSDLSMEELKELEEMIQKQIKKKKK